MMWNFRRGRAKPPEQQTPPEDAPILGVDYDIRINHNTTNPSYAYGQPCVTVSFHEPTGFLTRETFTMVREATRDFGSHTDAAMQKIMRYRLPVDAKGKPQAMTDADREHLKSAVDDVLQAIGQHQKDSSVDIAFMTRLREASRKAGRDRFDLIAQFEQMSADVQSIFTDEERTCFAMPEWRTSIAQHIRDYEHLRDASRALRREATQFLGEEWVRPVPVHDEHRSSGRVTTHDGHAAAKRSGFAGGYGCDRVNGHAHYGNGR